MKNLVKKLTTLALGSLILSACGSVGNNSESTQVGTEIENVENSDTKNLTIGIVQIADHPSLDAAREGFLEKLDEEEISYELIDHRANGDLALIPQFASDLKNKGVDLIYTIGTPAAQAVANQISDIPILFSAVTDPIGAGLVDEKTKVGANVSGVSDYVDPAKLIDDFLKIYPDTKTFGTMYNTNEQNSVVQIKALEKALDEKGLELKKQGVSSINEIPQAISSIKNKMDAMFTVTDNVVVHAMPVVSENLNKEKIPSVACDEGSVENGALMSEGVNYKECGKQVGDMAVKILKEGVDIKDIPYEDGKVIKTLVNKKTAELLGLDLNNLKDAEYVE